MSRGQEFERWWAEMYFIITNWRFNGIDAKFLDAIQINGEIIFRNIQKISILTRFSKIRIEGNWFLHDFIIRKGKLDLFFPDINQEMNREPAILTQDTNQYKAEYASVNEVDFAEIDDFILIISKIWTAANEINFLSTKSFSCRNKFRVLSLKNQAKSLGSVTEKETKVKKQILCSAVHILYETFQKWIRTNASIS